MAVFSIAGGCVFAIIGMGRLKATSIVPNRTLEQMRQDFAAAKDHMR